MMKKIMSEIHLSNFSYENCIRHGNVQDKSYQYSATINENFISLRSYQCEEALKINPNPLGWKFHISIDDEENNMILAWNVIAPILIENKINFSKFMRPKGHTDDSRQTYERGRQFTIYIEQNQDKKTQDWQDLINKITDRLVENNVKPGYINLVAKAVPGSSYFYYRNDKPKVPQADEIDTIAPSSITPKESEYTHIDIPEKPILSTASSPTLAEKSDQEEIKSSAKAGSTKKSPVVPMLNLKGALPIQSWTSIKPARAKETYLDNSIEKKYNPSNSEEGLLLPLCVDTKQPPPKDPPHVQLETK